MDDTLLNMPHIRVYIEGYHYISESLHIKNVLRKMFNSHVVSFCEDIVSSDLIITNNLIRTDSHTDIFYMECVFDEENWRKLISFLIIEKTIKMK